MARRLTRAIYLSLRNTDMSKAQIMRQYGLERAELYALLAEWGLDTAISEVEALRKYRQSRVPTGVEVRVPKALRRKLGRNTVLVPVDVFANNMESSRQLAADFDSGTLKEELGSIDEYDQTFVEEYKDPRPVDTGSVQLTLDFNGETVWEVRHQGAEWEPSRLVAAAMLYQSQRAHGAPSTKAIAAVAAAVGVSPAATYQRLKTVGITPRNHKQSKTMRRYYRSKKQQATRCSARTGADSRRKNIRRSVDRKVVSGC